MKFKKAVSAFAALTMAVSAFASLGVTANAEGTVNAALTHTASYNVDFGDNAGKTTCDAEKEELHMYSASNYTAIAYAEFDLSEVPDGETIADATLTYYAYNNKRTIRSITLKYVTDMTGVDLANLTGTIQNLSGDINAANINSTNIDSPTKVVVDVKSAVGARLADDKIIFSFAGMNDGGYLMGKGSASYAPTLSVTTTTAPESVVTVKYSDGTDDITALVDNAYDKTINTYVGLEVTPNYPISFVNGGYLYEYVSGGDKITADAETEEINLVYKKTEFTVPEAQTTGSEPNYLSLIDNSNVLSGTINKALSNVAVGRTYVLEYDAYVADGARLEVFYQNRDSKGVQARGPKLILDATSANDTSVYIKYDTSNTAYNILTSDDAKYASGTWAHVKAVCELVGYEQYAERAAIKPIKMTVTPSKGTTWEGTQSFTNNREIAGRNLKPAQESNQKAFGNFDITGNGTVCVANMVTYAYPTPALTTAVADTDGTTAIPAITDADTFINAADVGDTMTYADLKAKGAVLKTIYAKIENTTDKPVITIGGAEQASKWTQVGTTGVYFAQFVGDEADFGTGGAFENVAVKCGSLESNIVWTAPSAK